MPNANTMQPTGGMNYNPANGPFDLPTTVASRGGKVILHNRSPYDLNFTFNHDVTRNGILLAWNSVEFDFAGKQTDTINISVFATPSASYIAAAPSSYVVGECYAPGQPLPKLARSGIWILPNAPQIGPGALQDTIAIGTAPGPAPLAAPVGDDERVGVELFGGHDSGVYGGGNSAFLGSRSGACLFKMNNYWDGLSDKFILAATAAYQFFLTNDGIIHVRSDDGTNRVAGGSITWLPDVFSVSAAGVITAGTIAGAQVTGDIAATQVGPGALDTDVTMSANQITAGTLIAAVHLAAIFSDGGAIVSDGAGKLTTTNRFNWNGTLSGADKVIIAIQPTDAATKLYELLYKASNNHLYLENVTDAIILLDISNTGALSVTDLLTALNGINVAAGKQVNVNNTLSGGGTTGKYAFSDPDTSSAYLDLNADRHRIVGSYLGAANAEIWSIGLQNADVLMHGVLNGVTRINLATSEGIQDVTGSLQLFSRLSGVATGLIVTTWNGSAAVTPFSVGGQFNSALAYIDASGNIFTAKFSADGGLITSDGSGNLTAHQFNGPLNGNANTATSANTAKQTDSTNAGSATVPQIIASGTTGISVKDDGGVSPNVHVLISPTENDAVARGIELGYVDGSGNLHAGSIQRSNGVFAAMCMDNGTATLRQCAVYKGTTDPSTYATMNEGDEWTDA